MSRTLQTFSINIAILEGRHYIWPNTNSAVMVQVDNQKRITSVKFNTNCPFYNEYFVFECLTTFEEIIDKNVIITVIKPGSVLRKRKILGCVSFDVGTVWYQKDHQLYHKWAILTSRSTDFTSGTQGYIKLDVSVLSKGQVPKIPPFINTDDIEGNLFLPNGSSSNRQMVNFIFDVYRARDLVKRNATQEGVKKYDNLPTTQIGIFFAGVTVKTTIKKNSYEPVWNERLLLPEFFPPLCQRFKIELYHEGNRRAIRYLNIRTISNDKEDGFLPTFGPSFLHFYSPNNLEGYLGKILLSLQSSLLGDVSEYEIKSQVVQSVVTPLNEEYKLQFEQVVLFATIFEVSSIISKFNDKPISFRLSCGPTQMDEHADKAPITTPIKSKTTNRNYSYLPINENKPYIQLNVTLPDVRKRMFNYNLLTKISRELKMRLEKIEHIYCNTDYKSATFEIKLLLDETIDFVTAAVAKYIDIASNYNLEKDSSLDQQRMSFSLREMQAIAVLSNEIRCYQSKQKKFQKLEKIYTRIQALIDIIEDWPQIYLWMIHGNKRVAYHIMQPRNVIHSLIEEERGINCGSLQTIYFQTETNYSVADFIESACKMDVMVWMGFERHFNTFISSLSTFSFEHVPRNLMAQENHSFQAQVYIFQGKFSPGFDKSGLCDPFVHVIIGSQFRETEILRNTLTPVWDQTLIFPRIVLYGTRELIRANPPSVCFEVYDRDDFCKVEFVGKSVYRPVVKMRDDPPTQTKLLWHIIHHKFHTNAEILAAVDLQEVSENSVAKIDDSSIIRIPPEIKPVLVNYRLEIVFWGVRDLKKVQMMQITKPKILMECSNCTRTAGPLSNAKKNPNFTNPIHCLEVRFPEPHEYAPPLSIKMFDCRNFGINAFAGSHVEPLQRFFQKPLTAHDRQSKILQIHKDSLEVTPSLESVIKALEKTQEAMPRKKNNCWVITKWIKQIWHKKEAMSHLVPENISIKDEKVVEDSTDFDWWTKFYASLEGGATNDDLAKNVKHTLKIYPQELEKQPEFNGFKDTLMSFYLYKGKRTGDETVDEENTTGTFKGAVSIYRWPLDSTYVTSHGLPLQHGMFQDFPSNSQMRYVLRVYCVRALDLPPKDIDGKSDPYVCLTLNQQRISDREHYVPSQLNPIFGKCFEMKGVFPQDHTLVITLMDYDKVSSDDVIGETKIDLENRVYTKHRAHCGLATNYFTSGYCQWRDQQKPTTILEKLCKRFNISDLQYRPTSVTVAARDFCPKNFKPSGNVDFDHQTLALEALKHWSDIPIVGCALVPEHVETRSLFNSEKPGIEQLWIDILPCGDLPTPTQVNIGPRKPEAYELRVIVWNAQNVTLEETDVISGGKKSDIYVKGWVTAPESAQYTDVHYRSLTGEANFNWRFVFGFEYLRSENQLVDKRKSMFGRKEQEVKMPCKLTLQVWDNDTFSYDDFLGVAILELSKLPRGADSAKNCSLKQLQSGAVSLNLFKTRRTKGWWPVKSYDLQNRNEVFAGALELEFELLKKEDALKSPVGLGRDDPQGLAKPSRPETAFSWVHNPFAAVKFTWKTYRKKLTKFVVLLVVILIVIVIGINIPRLIEKYL